MNEPLLDWIFCWWQNVTQHLNFQPWTPNLYCIFLTLPFRWVIYYLKRLTRCCIEQNTDRTAIKFDGGILTQKDLVSFSGSGLHSRSEINNLSMTMNALPIASRVLLRFQFVVRSLTMKRSTSLTQYSSDTRDRGFDLQTGLLCKIQCMQDLNFKS